jgi:hypothetical protein
MGQGKRTVKIPIKVKQGNPKGKRSVKSMPIGFKGAKVKTLKGGTGEKKAAKTRGGMGATRPNFGKAIRSHRIKGLGL